MKETLLTSTKSCPVKIEPAKTDGPVKKLVRRIVQQVKPCHARVRYDVDHKMWAVLDDNNKPIRHFEYGVMNNVKLEPVYIPGRGCGSAGDYIGVAEGELQENTYGAMAGQWENMEFKAGDFYGTNGVILRKLERVVLMPERRSVYQK